MDTKILKKPPLEDIIDRCTCKEYDYEEDECPYSKDVGDKTILCKCCPYCRSECLHDI